VRLIDTGARPVAAPRGRRRGGPSPECLALLWEAAVERSRTLDDVLSGAWEGLTAASPSTACPVCEGELVPRWSAGAGVVGGRCRDCGSELS
jgi:hypothetical protein